MSTIIGGGDRSAELALDERNSSDSSAIFNFHTFGVKIIHKNNKKSPDLYCHHLGELVCSAKRIAIELRHDAD